MNLFVPSELEWPEKGFRLRQETRYPEAEEVNLTVSAAQEFRRAPGEIAIRLRIPGWMRSAPTVKVNGTVLSASAEPGSYLTLNREWKAGDKIEMRLPMHVGAEAMPDDPRLQALVYGPLVLAGDLGGNGLTEDHISGPNLRVGAPDVEQNGSPLSATNRTPPVPEVEIPTFRAGGREPESWIEPGSKSLTFRTKGQKRDLELVPLNRVFKRRYATYWQVSS